MFLAFLGGKFPLSVGLPLCNRISMSKPINVFEELLVYMSIVLYCISYNYILLHVYTYLFI